MSHGSTSDDEAHAGAKRDIGAMETGYSARVKRDGFLSRGMRKKKGVEPCTTHL